MNSKKRKLNQLFEILDNNIGWRGWWPTTPPKRKEPEYHSEKNYFYTNRELLEICIGTILTQNTNWKNVSKSIIELNKLNIHKVSDFFKYEDAIILNAIKSSGYYNQKLKKLKILFEFLKKNDFKHLSKLNVQDLRNKFLNLWGIGKETADSIILYAFNKPIFIIDTYTRRVLYRTGIIINEKNDYDNIRNFIEKNLNTQNILDYKNYHALIVEICKLNCKKKRNCENCLLKTICKTYLN